MVDRRRLAATEHGRWFRDDESRGRRDEGRAAAEAGGYSIEVSIASRPMIVE